MADGQKRAAAAALVDRLAADVQEPAGLLGRKHPAGVPHHGLPVPDFLRKIDCIEIDLRDGGTDRADVGQHAGQRANVGRCRHRGDQGGLVRGAASRSIACIVRRMNAFWIALLRGASPLGTGVGARAMDVLPG